MLPERLLSIFRRDNPPPSHAQTYGSHQPQPAARGTIALRKPGRKEPPSQRPSRGLEQFFYSIRDVVGLAVLDCAGANQDNINFLIELGHKVYSQDLVRGLDEAFGPGGTQQANAAQIDSFIANNFNYSPETFDGVLLWDALQFMSPPLLHATVDRLY